MNRRLKIAWICVQGTLATGGNIYTPKDGLHLYLEKRLSNILDISFLTEPFIFRYIGYKASLPYKLRFSGRIAKHLIRHRPDLLVTTGFPHIEGFFAFVIGKLLRTRILLQETHWYWPKTLAARLSWPVNLWLVHRTTVLIVPGRRVEAYWQSAGIRPNMIHVVPFYTSAVEISAETTYSAGKLRKRLVKDTILLYFGRLIKRKGINYLIEAFAKLKKEIPNTALIIAGDGPELDNLQRQCANKGLNQDVVFTGMVKESMKPAYFIAADIYVYPSITLETPEEWALGVVEALSAGKPVVATFATGCALDAVWNGVNGYVVREKDSRALYDTIRNLVINADLRRQMGLKSRVIFERHFTYSEAVRAFLCSIRLALQEARAVSCLSQKKSFHGARYFNLSVGAFDAEERRL